MAGMQDCLDELNRLKEEQVKLKSDIEDQHKVCNDIAKDIALLPENEEKATLSAKLDTENIKLQSLKARGEELESEIDALAYHIAHVTWHLLHIKYHHS